jgi:hypothetical protein
MNAAFTRTVLFVAALLAAAARASAVSFDITYVDGPGSPLNSRGWLDPNSLFQQNIRAALAEWGRQFDSDATLVVRVDTHVIARAGGSFSYGRFLSTNAQGKEVWEVGPLTRMLTGSNPGEGTYGYDIVLGFDADFVEQNYWFDPAPTQRTAAVPANKGDFVTVVMHEMGHALGIGGNRDFPTGQFLRPDISQFDNLSYYGGNGDPFDAQGQPNPMFFGGDHTAAIYGSDVPLTHKPEGDPNYTQNFYHLGVADLLTTDGLELTLMNGEVLPNGRRLYLSSYDRALIADLGYPMATIQAGDFNADGLVNGADLLQWKAAQGTAGSDANQDGRSDGADFLLWQRYAGSSVASAAMAVPEPAAGIFAVVVVTFALQARRVARRLQLS